MSSNITSSRKRKGRGARIRSAENYRLYNNMRFDNLLSEIREAEIFGELEVPSQFLINRLMSGERININEYIVVNLCTLFTHFDTSVYCDGAFIGSLSFAPLWAAVHPEIVISESESTHRAYHHYPPTAPDFNPVELPDEPICNDLEKVGVITIPNPQVDVDRHHLQGDPAMSVYVYPGLGLQTFKRHPDYALFSNENDGFVLDDSTVITDNHHWLGNFSNCGKLVLYVPDYNLWQKCGRPISSWVSMICWFKKKCRYKTLTLILSRTAFWKRFLIHPSSSMVLPYVRKNKDRLVQVEFQLTTRQRFNLE